MLGKQSTAELCSQTIMSLLVVLGWTPVNFIAEGDGLEPLIFLPPPLWR